MLTVKCVWRVIAHPRNLGRWIQRSRRCIYVVDCSFMRHSPGRSPLDWVETIYMREPMWWVCRSPLDWVETICMRDPMWWVCRSPLDGVETIYERAHVLGLPMWWVCVRLWTKLWWCVVSCLLLWTELRWLEMVSCLVLLWTELSQLEMVSSLVLLWT